MAEAKNKAAPKAAAKKAAVKKTPAKAKKAPAKKKPAAKTKAKASAKAKTRARPKAVDTGRNAFWRVWVSTARLTIRCSSNSPVCRSRLMKRKAA